MRIYKIAFRNPIDIITNTLARKLFTAIRNLYNSGELFQNRKKSTIIDLEKYGKIPIAINIEFYNSYNARPFLITASFGKTFLCDLSTLRDIEINIKIAKNFAPEFFHDFYIESAMAFRHELQHMADDFEGKLEKPGYNLSKIDNSPSGLIQYFNERIKYLMDKSEQEPVIRGLMLECKKERKSLQEVLIGTIRTTLFSNDPLMEKRIKKQFGLQADHAERLITELYLRRAKEIFPNLF